MSVEILIGPSIILILVIIGLVYNNGADSSDSKELKEEDQENNALVEFRKRMGLD
jgi:hypothetical protein